MTVKEINTVVWSMIPKQEGTYTGGQNVWVDRPFY